MEGAERMRVLYFCEGYTDIRFVVGLSEICDLTMAIPAKHLHESGLAARLAESPARLQVDTIEGGRLAFQWRSLRYLFSRSEWYARGRRRRFFRSRCA